MSAGGMIRAGGCIARLRHLAPLTQPVGDHRLMATAHQGRLKVRADEAGATRDQDHGRRYRDVRESAEGIRPTRRRCGGLAAMSDRPRFFDDLAGVAGGALSALAGLREEAEALVRARIDEAIRRLDLVRREEMEALAELARQREDRPGGSGSPARRGDAASCGARNPRRSPGDGESDRVRLAARRPCSVGYGSWSTW